MMQYATGKIWQNGVIEVRTPIPSWLPCSVLFLRHHRQRYQVAAVVRRVLVAEEGIQRSFGDPARKTGQVVQVHGLLSAGTKLQKLQPEFCGGHLREPTPTGDHCLKQSQIGKWCDPGGCSEVRRNSLQGSSNCACELKPIIIITYHSIITG